MNNGGPAFPCPMGPDWPECDRGMTLRDWFAGQVLTHFVAEDISVAHVVKTLGMTEEEYIAAGHPYWRYSAKMAYEVADAMLAAREAGGADRPVYHAPPVCSDE